jgi:hypothetical protein
MPRPCRRPLQQLVLLLLLPLWMWLPLVRLLGKPVHAALVIGRCGTTTQRCWFGLQSSSSSSSNRLAAPASTTRRMVSTTTPTHTETMSNDPLATVEPLLPQYPLEMTEDERYLFDLQGFVIVRNVLTPDEVAMANAAIDRHAHDMVRRSDGPLRNVADTTSRLSVRGRVDWIWVACSNGTLPIRLFSSRYWPMRDWYHSFTVYSVRAIIWIICHCALPKTRAPRAFPCTAGRLIVRVASTIPTWPIIVTPAPFVPRCWAAMSS